MMKCCRFTLNGLFMETISKHQKIDTELISKLLVTSLFMSL